MPHFTFTKANFYLCHIPELSVIFLQRKPLSPVLPFASPSFKTATVWPSYNFIWKHFQQLQLLMFQRIKTENDRRLWQEPLALSSKPLIYSSCRSNLFYFMNLHKQLFLSRGEGSWEWGKDQHAREEHIVGSLSNFSKYVLCQYLYTWSRLMLFFLFRQLYSESGCEIILWLLLQDWLWWVRH